MTDILLVEDNRELSKLLKLFLEKDGYSMAVQESGEEALCFLSEHKVKMILLDVMLPGMDGFGFCAEVRKTSNTPIIIMSARVEKEDKLNGFVQGADDYLEKPVDVDILRAVEVGGNMIFRRDLTDVADRRHCGNGRACRKRI